MPKMMVRLSFLACCCLLLTITACANFSPIDKPASGWTPRTSDQIDNQGSSELLVLLAFSGGGTRAAAFSYGVLKALADIEITTGAGQRTLLNEVDVISSVSGGSFTAAYFGLKGDKIFEDYEERFLRKNFERALMCQLFSPVNWIPLMSSTYGRGDMAAEYFGNHIFDNATFADLKRPGAPMVVINATDLATGMIFAFTPFYFNFICNDWNAYPVSRAVTASSAVPLISTPISIQSFSGNCGFEPPPWLSEAVTDKRGYLRKEDAGSLMNYMDIKKRPWIHLVDGGIADNLGLRSFCTTLSLEGNPRQTFYDFGHSGIRQVLIIAVNAFTDKQPQWTLKPDTPAVSDIITSVSLNGIGRYNYDTFELVRHSYEKWTQNISTLERPVTFDLVEVSFDGVINPEQRRKLNAIGTNLNLSDGEVDLLISAAGEVLRGASEFQAFLKQNNGQIKQP